MKKILIAILTILAMTTQQSCREQAQSANPLLGEWDTPFGVPPFDKIKPEHYKAAFEQGMAEHKAQLDSIAASADTPGFGSVIAALDRSGGLLDRTHSLFSLIVAADNNDTLQRIDMEISPRITAHYDSIYMNDALFKKVAAVYENRSELNLAPEQRRLTEKTYERFVRAGALLTPRQKEQLARINAELTTLGIRFGNNLLAENHGFALIVDSLPEMAGLPEGVINIAADEAKARGHNGKWAFTLSKPSMLPVLTLAENRSLREKLYKGYLNRGNNGGETDNNRIVNDIVRLRTEKAHLLGYPSYAAYALADKMARTPEQVYGLLDKLWEPSLKLAGEELAEMKTLKAQQTEDSTFASWDWWYYAEKVRKQKYNLEEEMLRPYFTIENVRQGVFQLSNRLWGITFRPVNVPVYHKECIAYEVLDRDNTHLGILYFDFFPRAGKLPGAWCGTYRDEHYTADGRRVAPVVTIVCNFTPGVGSNSAQLSLDEVQTLFHEFGHAMHSLFSQVKFKGVGEVERDFVEMPSQVMENWATEPDMLRSYAKHYTSGVPMPDHLIRKIQQSKLFNQGFQTTELLAAALLDMDIHAIEEYKPVDLSAFEHEALTVRRGLMPEIAPRYRYPYFGHIFNGDGYSAGYYSYTWAEEYDKDAFHAFVETGDLFNRPLAQSYRKNILEKGGSEDAATLYRNFRGRDPELLPMLVSRGLAPEAELIRADSIRADSVRKAAMLAAAAARDSAARVRDSIRRVQDSLGRMQDSTETAAADTTIRAEKTERE